MARQPESTGAAATESLFAGARGWLKDAAELLRVRLDLLGAEAGGHALDLVQAVAWAVAAALLLVLGLGFLVVLLTVLLWDSHRLLALAVATAVFLALGVVALAAARKRLLGIRWFEASQAELVRDVERLRGRG